MHKKEKNSVVIAKKVVSSQRYSYITHIMEPEAKRLAVLEDAPTPTDNGRTPPRAR